MRYRIKIVPNDDCNGDGEWMDAEALPMDPQPPYSWIESAERFDAVVPKGFHLVAVEKAS